MRTEIQRKVDTICSQIEDIQAELYDIAIGFKYLNKESLQKRREYLYAESIILEWQESEKMKIRIEEIDYLINNFNS